MQRRPLAAALTVLAFALPGCGGDSDPIQEIAEANAAVAAARDSVEAAKQVVQARQTEVANAQKRLAEARADVQTAEQDLAQLEASVDRDALDTALFREVQRRLLEDDQLKQVAIAASVKQAVVTLSGDVDSEKLRDRAVQIASGADGVERVESRIEVSVSSPPPAPKADTDEEAE